MSCLAAQQVHSKGKMDSLVSANQCFLVCLLWWIASGAFRLTKNEAVIYEVYPSRWTNDQPPCVSAEIRADQTATTSLLHTWKLHRFWPLESHFYFFYFLVLSDISRSHSGRYLSRRALLVQSSSPAFLNLYLYSGLTAAPVWTQTRNENKQYSSATRVKFEPVNRCFMAEQRSLWQFPSWNAVAEVHLK